MGRPAYYDFTRLGLVGYPTSIGNRMVRARFRTMENASENCKPDISDALLVITFFKYSRHACILDATRAAALLHNCRIWIEPIKKLAIGYPNLCPTSCCYGVENGGANEPVA